MQFKSMAHRYIFSNIALDGKKNTRKEINMRFVIEIYLN